MRALPSLLAAALGVGCAAPVVPDTPPVVVGPDLTPADYACLGLVARAAPADDPRDVDVRVVEWPSGSAHPDVVVAGAAHDGWLDSLACPEPDCVSGVTDATGHVHASLRTGPLWFATSVDLANDPLGRVIPSVVLDLDLPPGATTLSLPLLTTRTTNQLLAAGVGPQSVLGAIRDCAGALVHRARIRHFDASGREQIADASRVTILRYADTQGGFGETERTTVAGAYFLTSLAGEVDRIEAWGARSFGGPEELLGCRVVRLTTRAPAFVDIPPLESDAPSECGSTP